MTDAHVSASMSEATTRAPSAANRDTIEVPSPPAAPVTRMTRPDRRSWPLLCGRAEPDIVSIVNSLVEELNSPQVERHGGPTVLGQVLFGGCSSWGGSDGKIGRASCRERGGAWL